ncbi:MAG: hypothetical protein PHX76_02325 [Patescibacteria group bacterium]|nr:hypothetical protein [Patescibacteria group bacterium]
MKQLIVFLLLVFIASHSMAQSAYEKEKMDLIESEIARLEKKQMKLKKELNREKEDQISKLKRDLKKHEKGTVYTEEASKIQAKIDSITNIESNFQLDVLGFDLEYYKNARRDLIESWTKQDVPRELSYYRKLRRSRANEIRREELVLEKIENNINQRIEGGAVEGGYKVIFDNKYSQNVTFILRALDGSQRFAISLAPRTKERHYILPGSYQVEGIISGRRLRDVSYLNIDGEQHYYETEPCFGFVLKEAY